MPRYFEVKPPRLESCALSGTGSGAELFIVEGESASSAVSGVRNQHFQAVLPMQGKPLNALRASPGKVLAFDLYQALSQALGVPGQDSIPPSGGRSAGSRTAGSRTAGSRTAGSRTAGSRSAGSRSEGSIGDTAPAAPSGVSALTGLRFDRVLLLFDPDADGIHCGALMLMYFYRWMRPLLQSGRIEMVRAPLFEIRWMHNDQPCEEPAQANSEAHHRTICEALRERGARDIKTCRYRGLGNIDSALLARTCVNPKTRRSSVLGEADARAAIEAFGPVRSLG